MKLTEAQLALLCDIADAAGREIMAVYAGPAVRAWAKDDDSPLTEADMRADAVIRAGLQRAFPGVFIWSEESTSGASAGQETFFLVDPLDGTKEFLKRNDEFTVNIALIHRGEAVAGVVLAPALGELYYAARGAGAWKRAGGQVTPLRVAPADARRPLRVMGSRSHGGDALAAWLAKLACEHEFVAAGSSLKFCRIADGRADIYPRMGPTSQWDTAAAQAVLQEAGGAVLNAAGLPLRYGLDAPVLNPHFVAVADPALQFPPIG
jgi:3'(2'), 5'-bisphosphate nucleotidase